MSSFELKIKEFAEMTERKSEELFQKTCFELSNGIIMDTPVDEGRLRGNWQPDIDVVVNEVIELVDKSGGKARAKVAKTVTKLRLGQTFTLTNNLPYAEVVEFGLYPNPPKKGTPYQIRDSDKFITESGYVILSQNGYSKKAPQGMVYINRLRFNNIVMKLNKTIK